MICMLSLKKLITSCGGLSIGDSVVLFPLIFAGKQLTAIT